MLVSWKTRYVRRTRTVDRFNSCRRTDFDACSPPPSSLEPSWAAGETWPRRALRWSGISSSSDALDDESSRCCCRSLCLVGQRELQEPVRPLLLLLPHPHSLSTQPRPSPAAFFSASSSVSSNHMASTTTAANSSAALPMLGARNGYMTSPLLTSKPPRAGPVMPPMEYKTKSHVITQHKNNQTVTSPTHVGTTAALPLSNPIAACTTTTCQ